MSRARDNLRKRRRALVAESASAVASPVQLVEVGPSGGTTSADESGQHRQVTIIQSGWGSSGYYSKEVLESDGPAAWPKGTHMYLNHPSVSENQDRPERDLRDLVGVIETDPVMVGKELQATATVFEHWAPVIDQLAPYIGVSIRAIGEMEHGEAEGRQGPIIKTLDEGISVDYVTKAGAGGKVGALIESARERTAAPPTLESFQEARNAGHWMESKIHSNFTQEADYLFGNGYVTRDERISMSSAIGDALDAFQKSLGESQPGLYERDPYSDPTQLGVGVAESKAASVAETSKEDVMSDAEKQALAELTESVKTLNEKVDTLTTERDEERKAKERAEEALLLTRAGTIVAEAQHTPEGATDKVSIFEGLPAKAVDRVKESALKGDLPLTEDGKLNEDHLVERAVKAAKEERDYLAEAGVVQSGSSRVIGMGESAGSSTEKSGEESTGKLKSSFARLGLSETAATSAAEGR